MTDDTVPELGPIDYVVVEWQHQHPTGDAIPYLIDLVDRGLIRILDLVFVTKGDDGTVTEVAVDQLGDDFAVLQGAGTDLLGNDDVAQAASVLEAGRSAAIIVYENSWAAPFAAALRHNGAQMVASGRIPVDALIEALDSAES